MEGLAQELGRVEQKLLQLLRRPSPEPGGDDGVPPWALPLLEALLSIGDSRTYTMPRPCERDENGDPLPPLEVVAAGALNQMEVTQNRIDALAELIALHKEVRQPNCAGPRPQGQGVTVTFQAVPEA
jgi:hypothetical protein